MNIQNAINDGFNLIIDKCRRLDDLPAEEFKKSELKFSNFDHAIGNPSENPEPRLLTGIPSLDNMFGEYQDMKGGEREFRPGFNKKDIMIIAGMQGMGKTTLAFNLFIYLHCRHYKPIFFSLDMREKRVWESLRKSMIGYEGTSADFINELAKYGSIPKIISLQRKICVGEIDLFLKDNPTSTIFVDYLNQLQPNKKYPKDKDNMQQLFIELKQLAEKYNCAIILLVQNMEDKGYKQGKPTLASMYGGMEVRAHIDHAIAVYRNGKYNENLDARFKNVTEILGLKLRSDDSSDVCYVIFQKGKIEELSIAEKNAYKFERKVK